MSIVENIQTNLDYGEYIRGVFTDLQKPFDSVAHGVLLQKLKHYRIRGVATQWFSTYI